MSEAALPDQALEKAFDKWWPDLETLLNDAVKEANNTNEQFPKQPRPQDEIIEEILELTRGISRQVVKGDEDETKDNMIKYILKTRYKDDPPLITWADLKHFKGKEIKKGSTMLSDLILGELDKAKDKENEDDESDD